MRDTYARARDGGAQIAVAVTQWHVPKKTLRDPPRSRWDRRRAHGEANRAVPTGQARFPADEYVVKKQEGLRGDGI